MKKPAPPKSASAKTAAPEGERIAKYLSRAGVASRREAERMIETGQVAVNGKVIDSPALNITTKDKITVNGKPVAPPEPARLWLYYKPEGLVTSASDEKGRETVFDHLPEDMPRVMSVGRLDLNSEGLLLLTNDGELKRRLELPSTGWLRKYRVRVKGNPTDPDLEPLRRGITVEGETFQPMQVVLDRHQGANAWLTVGLREGKNREIRRAMAEIGLTVNRLIRISYGPFRLNELQPGDVEEVRPKVLRDQLGLSGDAADDAPARRMTTRPADRGTPTRGKRDSAEASIARPSGARTRSRDAEEMPSRRTTRPEEADRPRRAPTTRKAEGEAPKPRFSAGTARREAEGGPTSRRTTRPEDGDRPRRAPTTRGAEGEAPKPRFTAGTTRRAAEGGPTSHRTTRTEEGDRPRSAPAARKSDGEAVKTPRRFGTAPAHRREAEGEAPKTPRGAGPTRARTGNPATTPAGRSGPAPKGPRPSSGGGKPATDRPGRPPSGKPGPTRKR
jgi:23S rRNA pseudouridine2605 synthase